MKTFHPGDIPPHHHEASSIIGLPFDKHEPFVMGISL
jgi:hypothetical protein